MKIGAIHIFGTVVICAVGIYLACCLGISAAKRAGTLCGGLKVTVVDSAKNNFVTVGDIKGYLAKEAGNFTGKPVGEIDLAKIESILDGKSAVLKSEAFITPDGIVNITVSQREPAIRFEGRSGGFYADSRGYIFPLQRNWTSKVTIVDGDIPLKIRPGYKGEVTAKDDRQWLDGIMELAAYIQKSKVWNGRIVQMSIRPNGDIIMVPQTGNEKFIFGDSKDYERKFALMEKYYTAIRPYKGEDFYRSVIVKYDGQIICRK